VSRSNSQVGRHSRIFCSKDYVHFVIKEESSEDEGMYLYTYQLNGSSIGVDRFPKHTALGYYGLQKGFDFYSQTRIFYLTHVHGGSDISFDSIMLSKSTQLINLIGLHNNKFYGIRNDDLGNSTYSPTLVHIDSVTGDIIYEEQFISRTDTVKNEKANLCTMTDEYGILVSGRAVSNISYEVFEWIAQVHPATAEVKWDTLIPVLGHYGNENIFSSGERHFLTGRTNTIHELTVPKIGWTPSSTESVTEKKRSKIYPNPASNVLHLDIHNPQSKVMIYTIEGKLMEETRGDQKKLDISGYPSGMYFVSIIEPSDAIETIKIVKK
jgi:hypothetical protein